MIQFTKPLYLLLLIPLVYYTYRLSKRSLADLSRFRSYLALGLRAAILVMLVFALGGARMVRDVSQQCVVFVLDVSDSIPEAKRRAALDYVNAALKTMRAEQEVGVIVFAGDASVEFAPCNINRIDKLYSVPTTSHTDISQALGLALASFPEQCGKKIVLVSDGNETMGKAIEQAMLAGSDNVSIDVVPVETKVPHEALLDKMICPSNVKVGEPFDLKVVAISKEPAAARIRILRNGEPVGVKTVDLPRGKSVLSFQQSIAKAGGYEFKAILQCDQDTRPENNIALANTKVHGKPKVLYVEGEQSQARYLAGALRRKDIEVDVRDRSGVPKTMAQLQGYDMVVLSDVPAWNLAPEQMAMIKSGVKDLGIGFTMIGGENSFGAGGYYDTPIEEALPVDMSVTKTKILPSLSVVIVMDKSGSMGAREGGVEKIRLANNAAAAVVKLLQPIDKVAVVVCHSWPVTAVKLQPAANKGPIYKEISTIRAEGGGIAVFPSMKSAYDMISASRTRQKHIILLADGSDCDDQEGCVPLAKKMARERITVTAVAIGGGPHVTFLKHVAAAGRGDFYLAQRARDLKAIFTKDVMTVSKGLIVEEPFVPRMDTTSPELSGIDAASVPPLLGYVAASAKPTARVLAASHKNDPILVTWQYGLGKSAAFTPDCKARWSARWLTWPGYAKFWAQLLRSTMRRSPPKDFQTAVDVSGGTGRIVVDAVDDKGRFLNFLNFAGSVVGPDMKARPIRIEQTGPGRYEASFDARTVGSYVVNISRRDQETSAPEVNVVNIPYPPEYKDTAPNTLLLKRLASETSGAFSPRASEVFRGNFRHSMAYTDLWRLLALLAVLVLPLDVAVRRLSISPRQVAEAYHTVRDRVRAGIESARTARAARPTVETVSTLLDGKKRRAGSLQQEPTQPPRVGMDTPKPAAPEPDPVTAKSAEKPEPHREPASEGGITSRLLEAKKRAREGKDNP